MITYTLAKDTQDLDGIISLQKSNLPQSLTPDEMQSQGFVTVIHSPHVLKELNDIEPHIIAKADNEVVAYLLTMTLRSRNDIPILIPMFEQFDKLPYKGRLISDYSIMVVGQVCVSKHHRGKGIFDDLYAAYREQHAQKYDFAITEIARLNLRSMQAHKRVGFNVVHTYTDPMDTDWSIVLWDWGVNG
jgi:hypothetical protein